MPNLYLPTTRSDPGSWEEALEEFLKETPDGARFFLAYFGKPLHEFSIEELAQIQQGWEQRAIRDLPSHLRARIG